MCSHIYIVNCDVKQPIHLATYISGRSQWHIYFSVAGRRTGYTGLGASFVYDAGSVVAVAVWDDMKCWI